MESTLTDQVVLPDQPAIPGLRFRHFRGDEDYPALLAVNTGSKKADGLEFDLHTLDTLRGVYVNTANHDPRRDMIIGEVDGQSVSYVRTFWERELSGDRVYYHVGFVIPEWRGRGIGRAQVHWAEAHARAIEAGQAEAAPAYISAEVYGGMAAADSLLQAEGYEAVRHEYHMETPDLDHIPDVPMPTGLEVRPVRPEHYHAIWAANAEAFRDHWGARETEEGDFERWLAGPMMQPDLWMVAWEGDEVAGSILNYVNHEYNANVGRNIGYTESISVRRPWRKRGLARALLARSMKMHRNLGMTQTALGVDAQNPSGALQLYESMGYEVVHHGTFYRKPL